VRIEDDTRDELLFEITDPCMFPYVFTHRQKEQVRSDDSLS
jgi:hypothetical protein